MGDFRTIGFVGLGVMGEPMCENLAKKSSLPILAYDIDPSPLDRLASVGVKSAAAISEIAEQADLIFLSLPDIDSLRHVCDELSDYIQESTIIVDTSTSSVRVTREMGLRFELKNCEFVDAPVARTRAAARDGSLSIMVGGSDTAFQKLAPILNHMGSEITHCGDVGSGQVVKILNNMVLAETITALAEAMAIARRSGVEPELLFETLSKGSADSFALRNHGMNSMLPGIYPKKAFPVDYMIKDINYALQLAQDTGVLAKGADHVADLLLVAKERGMSEAYFPVIASVLDIETEIDVPEGD